MIIHLSVKNLAIVAAATVEFGTGLNIITGETGAGKSILMGALDLVLGARADKTIIRDGADTAAVEAVFAFHDTSELDAILSAAGIPPCEEGNLVIRRTLALAGASRCMVNNSPATLQTLRQLGLLLVDIHGAYDHQSLLDADFQLRVLDAYGHTLPLLLEYQEIWSAQRKLQQQLDELIRTKGEPEAERERLNYIIDEITAAALSSDDEEVLVQQHAEAANAEQILAMGNTISELLDQGNGAMLEQLANLLQVTAELQHILPTASEWRREFESVTLQLQELNRGINGYLSRIDANPELLQQLEQRMAVVQRLKRKYGPGLAEVQQTLQNAHQQLDELEQCDHKIDKLEAEIDGIKLKLQDKADVLSQARAQAANKLATDITRELHGLGFLKSEFTVTLKRDKPAFSGVDMVEFGFAPNPGEAIRPLRLIASSGEIARVMLAVKTVLAEHDKIPVLVFDEIDANIGGDVGRAVGEKMRRVAEARQVIAITHLPQCAVFGSHHFVVRKEVAEGRTLMQVSALNKEERIDEIARMLGGRGSTDVVESHARELLHNALKKRQG